MSRIVQAERALCTSKGALIVGLTDAVARGTGLRVGDVILAINQSVVGTARQFADLLEAARDDQAFRIYFLRNGRYVFTDLVFR